MNCNALLTDDARPIGWYELTPFYDKLGIKYIRVLSENNTEFISDDDTLLAWSNSNLTKEVNDLLNDQPHGTLDLDELYAKGVMSCSFSIDDEVECSEDQIEELQDGGYDDEYIDATKKGTCQIEVNVAGEDGLKFVRQIAQVLAYLRGGIWMDSPTAEECVVIKGDWATPEFLENDDAE